MTALSAEALCEFREQRRFRGTSRKACAVPKRLDASPCLHESAFSAAPAPVSRSCLCSPGSPQTQLTCSHRVLCRCGFSFGADVARSGRAGRSFLRYPLSTGSSSRLDDCSISRSVTELRPQKPRPTVNALLGPGPSAPSAPCRQFPARRRGREPLREAPRRLAMCHSVEVLMRGMPEESWRPTFRFPPPSRILPQPSPGPAEAVFSTIP